MAGIPCAFCRGTCCCGCARWCGRVDSTGSATTVFSRLTLGRHALTGRGMHDGLAAIRHGRGRLGMVNRCCLRRRRSRAPTGSAEREYGGQLSSTGTSSTAAQQPTLGAATWWPPDDTTHDRTSRMVGAHEAQLRNRRPLLPSLPGAHAPHRRHLDRFQIEVSL